MKIALINGSPRRKNSASAFLLKELSEKPADCVCTEIALHARGTVTDTAVSELLESDALVLAFPLYVDGVPSHLLAELCEMQRLLAGRKPLSVYAMVNCGFFEGQQAKTALRIVENWCVRCGFGWCGGIGIGGGGMLLSLRNVPAGHGPRKPVSEAVSCLSEAIRESRPINNRFVSPAFPRLLYKLAAQSGWREKIRKNGLRPKDLSRRL